jgi:anti-sigma B factor antagonist
MPDLRFDITSDGRSRTVIAVEGEVDLATAPQLADCLLDQTGSDVLLKLSGVTFLDAQGIAAIIQGHNALHGAGRTLRIAGERDNVRKVLDIAGLLTVLHDDND